MMAKAIRKTASNATFAERMNRLLTGEGGDVVDVHVEVVNKTPDVMVEHNLQHVSDVDTADFFMPLILLFAVFVSRYFPLGVLVSAVFQLLLLQDLRKRTRRRASSRKAAGMVPPYRQGDWLWSLAIYLASTPCIFAAHWLNRYCLEWVFPVWTSRIEVGWLNLSASMGTNAIDIFFLLVLLWSVVVMAPLTEEIWFRGIGLAGLTRKSGSPIRAALWTSVIFGILHGPGRFMFSTVFGMVMALIRFRTGSIHCCMAIHALHNFAVVALTVYAVAW